MSRRSTVIAQWARGCEAFDTAALATRMTEKVTFNE